MEVEEKLRDRRREEELKFRHFVSKLTLRLGLSSIIEVPLST